MKMFDLTEEQYQLLLRVHAEHMKYCGSELKKKYTLDNAKSSVGRKREDCLKIYFDDIWWHYTKTLEWW
jgi:hypothetical protein